MENSLNAGGPGQGRTGKNFSTTTRVNNSTIVSGMKSHTKERLIVALFLFRSLNRNEAIKFGDSVLSTTVSNLTQKGIIFTRTWEMIQCVYRRKKVRVVRYSLTDEEKVKARRLLGINEREAA
jgi:hypothetical protein